MEGAAISYNFASTDYKTKTPENGSHLQQYWIWNDDVPDFLIHMLSTVYFTFGTCLNATLLVYIVMAGRWKSPIFTVIGSLAIADTMVCVASVLWATFVFPVLTSTNHSRMCHLSMLLGYGGMCTGGGTLVFFAALRYYQLKYPLAARARVTCKFVIKVLICVWCFCLNYGGVLWGIMYRPKMVYINGKTELICEQIGSTHPTNITFLIIDTTIPCVSITVLHLAKYFTVSRSHRDIDVRQKRLNTDARAVSIVILMFIICWIPVNLYPVTMGTGLTDYHMFQDKLYIAFLLFTSCNSTFNPIIYCIAAKTVRDDFVRFLCCRGKGAHKNSSTYKRFRRITARLYEELRELEMDRLSNEQISITENASSRDNYNNYQVVNEKNKLKEDELHQEDIVIVDGWTNQHAGHSGQTGGHTDSTCTSSDIRHLLGPFESF